VRNGIDFKRMFKKSGMNHFIGDWNFKSMENVESLSIFFSMLGATECDDLSSNEREQLNNFVEIITCTKND